MTQKSLSFIIIAKPGNSVDRPLSSLLVLFKKYSLPVDVHIVWGLNPSSQRNHAANLTSMENIIFLDNDSLLSFDYIDYIADAFRAYPNLVGLGGVSEIEHNENPWQKTIKYVFASAFGIGPLRPRYNSQGKIRLSGEKELILCNLLVKREIFLKLKGFHPELYPNEENEFLERLKKHGEILHHPLLTVSRPSRKSVISFILQMKNYGRGRTQHFLLTRKISDTIYFFPMFFALYIMLLPISLIFPLNLTFPIHLLPLFAYLLLNLMATFTNWFSIKDSKVLLRISFAFFLCHFFYGLGLIEGFLKKRKDVREIDYISSHFVSILDIENFLNPSK